MRRAPLQPDSPPARPLPIAARRHPLVAEVERRLRTRGGVPVGAALVVGASGGADSTALLLATSILRDRDDVAPLLRPVAAHVHHHLRADADDDAAWVQALAARLGLPCHLEHVHPQDEGGNIAATARRLRYEALVRIARTVSAAHVAVAHQGDDQLETMLIALCRGTGLDGLAGMPWSRPLSDDVHVVRPLLGVRRADCEDFCRAAEVAWRDDPSNADPTRARARLRRDVLPVLESLWPDAARRVTGTADLVDEARSWLAGRLAESFGPPTQRRWDRTVLAPLSLAVIAAGLRRAAVEGRGVNADDIGQAALLAAAEAIRDDQARPREFSWPGGLMLRVRARTVELSP